jgi:FkbM family methyltransferase
VCVEALPEYADVLRQNRTARCVNAAIAAGNEKVELVTDPTRLFSGISPPREEIEQIFDSWEMAKPQWEPIQVTAMTLSDLLDDCPPVDFLSLDIEGAELDALEGMGDHRPRVLLVESDTGGEKTRAIDEYLLTVGYQRARSFLWNHFYVQTDTDAERLRAVRAIAWLQRPPHPLRPS